MPAAVRNTTALGSGIEWVKVTSSISKGPMSRRLPREISVISGVSSSPSSTSLRRSSAAVKGVA